MNKLGGLMSDEKIMIVEDDALLAADLNDIVLDLGYRASGIADTFESARALAPFSTIALVDVNLRDGATGPRIGQYLTAEFGIAVVMVTASPEALVGDLSGVVGVIVKPVQPALVRNVLEYLKEIRKGGERGAPPRGLRLFG